MAHKGLTSETVIKAAAELIEQHGYESFSMRLLADHLGIKTASLYNHVENMDALLSEVCRYGLCLQKEEELQAIEGKHGEEAVRILAETYRRFAKEHWQLYDLIMNRSAKDHRVLDDAAVLFTDPLKQMLQDFKIRKEDSIHYRRLFRALVHGFVSQEELGFFSHYPANAEDSFHFAIQCYIENLKRGQRTNHDEK